MVYGLDFLERLIQYAYSGYGIAFDEKLNGVLAMTILVMLHFLPW